MITIELMRDMVLTMRKNDIPPKQDKYGKYYQLHFMDNGIEHVHKAYFRDQHTITLNHSASSSDQDEITSSQPSSSQPS